MKTLAIFDHSISSRTMSRGISKTAKHIDTKYPTCVFHFSRENKANVLEKISVPYLSLVYTLHNCNGFDEKIFILLWSVFLCKTPAKFRRYWWTVRNNLAGYYFSRDLIMNVVCDVEVLTCGLYIVFPCIRILLSKTHGSNESTSWVDVGQKSRGLHAGPLFDLCFYMTIGVQVWLIERNYWFLVVIHVLYITPILPIICPVK